MSDQEKPPVGSIGWVDLTVDDADGVRDFYKEVVGWTSSPVPMGDYEDYAMVTPEGEIPTAGVCHAQGTNAGLPTNWLIYITVADLDQSVSRCEALGGSLVTPIKIMGGYGRYCVIADPAGAVAALFEPA